MSAQILLCTLNSTYQHASFGLRYLWSNMKELQNTTQIHEWTISQNPQDIAQKIIEMKPRIVGFGIYIWNTDQTLEVIQILKKVAPEVCIVLGGPEVSYETEDQSIVRWADFVIKGEADLVFYEFCQAFLKRTDETLNFSNPKIKINSKIISGPLPELDQISYPYKSYSEEDIKNRIIYVEASRGCPYKCEYCLSSLDLSVRNFPLQTFLEEMAELIKRGVRQFKFVDRTFNLSPKISTAILEFFLQHKELGLFLHFEMVPDRLPDELKNLIQSFPEGSLQFEIGVQTFNPEVAKNVSRRQNYQLIEQNLQFLKNETHVHTHVDLIVGLPGETFESFGRGLDQLVALDPDEIQIGILKRLKGFPLARHDLNFKMSYQESPPFQVIQNKDLSFSELYTLLRFAKFWDLVMNSGQFRQLTKIWKNRCLEGSQSFFKEFLGLVEFLNQKHPQSHSIALLNLTESLWCYFSQKNYFSEPVAEVLARDYAFGKRRDLPLFLKKNIPPQLAEEIQRSNFIQTSKTALPSRQQRHHH